MKKKFSIRPVADVHEELSAFIQKSGLQEHIEVSRHPIDFLYEVYGIPHRSRFNIIIKELKDSISRMDATEMYKSCPACSHWLVNTGGESWHTSTSIFFFCLYCGGIYEWYRDKDSDKMKPMYRLKTHRLLE